MNRIVILVTFGLFLSYTLTSAQNNHFAVGYAAEQQGKYLTAIKEYNKAVSGFPGAEKDLKRVLNILLKKYQKSRDKNLEVFILKTYNETKNPVFNSWLDAIYKKIASSLLNKQGIKENSVNPVIKNIKNLEELGEATGDIEFIIKLCGQVPWKNKIKQWDLVRAKLYEVEYRYEFFEDKKIDKLCNALRIFQKYSIIRKDLATKISKMYLSAFLLGSYAQYHEFSHPGPYDNLYKVIFKAGDNWLLDSAKYYAKQAEDFSFFKALADKTRDKAKKEKNRIYDTGITIEYTDYTPTLLGRPAERMTTTINGESNAHYFNDRGAETITIKVDSVNYLKNALSVYELIGDKENVTRCKLILGIK